MIRVKIRELQGQIRNVTDQKDRAVQSEDFVTASTLKKQLSQLQEQKQSLEIEFHAKLSDKASLALEAWIVELSTEITNLDRLKYDAADREDFAAATIFKKKILIAEEERAWLMAEKTTNKGNNK